MSLRVCIFSRETLLHWAGYYVSAFRKTCDTISIGAAAKPEDHDFPDWSHVERYVVRNDIISDALDAPTLLALLPEGWEPDVVVAIQSGGGTITGISELGCPTVYLSVDTWHDPREFLLGYQYDFIFLAQKGLVKYMRQVGCCRAFWLPLGCDPECHYAAEGDEAFDISFIGSTHFHVNNQRVARLKVLEQHFSLGFTYGLGTDEMAQAYGRTKLIFNASIAQDVNMRVFEALATGKPLITNREAEANGLFDLFEEEKHLITYTDENLVQQVRRCLDNPDWARAIGQAGRREVLEKHTYVHRVQSVLKTLGEYIPQLGTHAANRLKSGLRVAEFIPLGTRRLLDVGMGLDSSRVALHRSGVEHIAAVAFDDATEQRRGKSYDHVFHHTPDMEIGNNQYDAVLWERPLRHGVPLEEVFEDSTTWLVEGGRLLLIMEESELAELVGTVSFKTLNAWLKTKAYNLLVWRRGSAESSYHLLVACQCSSTATEVLDRLYEEFPVNGVETKPAAGIIDVPTPDSPDAECP